MFVDRRRYRLHPRHQRIGGGLARLRPRAQDRKGRERDLRQGRRSRRDRVRKLQQCQGRRRAGSHRRLRRSRQRHHGHPARRVPDPRIGAGPRHADQESQHHLCDGVVGGVGQYSGRRSLLRVQSAVRQAGDAALHADSPGRARHHLYRRVRGVAPMGRPLHLAVFRSGRLDHEAVQVAAPAAHSRRGAGRHDRALHVHLDRALRHDLDAASGGRSAVRSRHRRPGAAVVAGHPQPRRAEADADELPASRPSIPRSCSRCS